MEICGHCVYPVINFLGRGSLKLLRFEFPQAGNQGCVTLIGVTVGGVTSEEFKPNVVKLL